MKNQEKSWYLRRISIKSSEIGADEPSIPIASYIHHVEPIWQGVQSSSWFPKRFQPSADAEADGILVAPKKLKNLHENRVKANNL